MKLLTILGARPQFIKAAAVSRAIRMRSAADPPIEEIIIHTGQHFDANMSQAFFDQLDIPPPRHNLGISSLAHGAMTGRMLEPLEALIQQHQPDWVLVYGDTNSTLAGALAAAKLQVPVAHVEAGLRSHNPAMPEEINRVLTHRVSTLLLCPTDTAVANLQREGFPFPAPVASGSPRLQRIEQVGDVMFDAVRHARELARQRVQLERFGLHHDGYALCTLHRQENTDAPERLHAILAALRQISREWPVVLPLHPRIRAKLAESNHTHALDGLILLDPLPYLEMQRLQMSARVILTDSGGIQKEAYFHQLPCITLREETEWVETVDSGWNQLTGADPGNITTAFRNARRPTRHAANLFGDGYAAGQIINSLCKQPLVRQPH